VGQRRSSRIGAMWSRRTLAMMWGVVPGDRPRRGTAGQVVS
jgi:hypothetical protein